MFWSVLYIIVGTVVVDLIPSLKADIIFWSILREYIIFIPLFYPINGALKKWLNVVDLPTFDKPTNIIAVFFAIFLQTKSTLARGVKKLYF